MDLKQFRAREDEVLHSYGWIDPDKKVVRIPIESEAMELGLAKEGVEVKKTNLTAKTQRRKEGRKPKAKRAFLCGFASLREIGFLQPDRRRGTACPESSPAADQSASNVRPGALKNVGIDQKLNNQIPLDLHFRDETGRDVRLGEFFTTRPVIITPVYYGCPMLCTQILNGLVSGLSRSASTRASSSTLLAVASIRVKRRSWPSRRKTATSSATAVPGAENGFHFLTGGEASIKRAHRRVWVPLQL